MKLYLLLLVSFSVLALAGCAVSGVPSSATSTATSVPPTASTAPSTTPVPPTETPTEVPPTAAPTTPPENAIQHYPGGQEFTVTNIWMVDANTGWAIGGLGALVGDHVLFTTDGGNTWKDVTPPEPQPATGQMKSALGYFQDASTAWVTYFMGGGSPVASQPAVWRTTDGGANWTASQPLDVNGLSEIYVPTMMQFYGQQSGWILVHVGAGMNHDYIAIYRTSDGGASWTRIIDPYIDGGVQSCTKNAIHFTTPKRGWLTGDCNGVKTGVLLYQTNDAGSTWQEVTLPGPAGSPDLFSNQNIACGTYNPFFFGEDLGILSVQCSNYGGAAITYSYYIYTTQDGGSTWSGNTYPGNNLYFFTASTGWALAPKIQMTSDGGKTWKPISDVSWYAQFDFISETTGWAIARSDVEMALVKTDNGGAKWSMLVPTVK
ncbi:MAG TPA: hypothetical protein VLD65_05480 [Anaerolineales bacterium]|nr:hypothetical protein [Anaerolineales bacterium]